MYRQMIFVLLCAWLTGAPAWPQRTAVPMGILEARLLSVAADALTLDLGAERTLACRVDGRTFIDRDRVRLSLNDLKPGDLLELVTERQGPAGACFARMIHIVGLSRRFPNRGVMGSVKRSTESFAPRGNLEVTGLVRNVQDGALELRTRLDGIMRFRLRPDTTLLSGGIPVSADQLVRNQPVFVRAGYDHDGQLEVYQICWGAILQPETHNPRPSVEPL
jgi:hypothetical protein